MKKLIAVIAVVIIAIGALTSLVACEQADYTIGICQLVQHPALDAATQGFIDALQEEMDKAGKTVKFDKQNAQNDDNICSTIINKFVAQNVDLILANATSPLSTAKNATKTIPILGTSITSYEVALNTTIPASGIVGGNVSGTSDLAPLDTQAQMILDLVGQIKEVKKVGLLYCSAENNSKYQVKVVRAYLEAKGVTCTEYTFTDTSDLQAVTTSAAQNNDAIYVPTDNTVAATTSTVDAICSQYKTPVIAGEEGICKGCGIATLSISYYNIGVATGKMAAKILLEGADISAMSIQYDEAPVFKYDEARCAEYGITVPESYEKIS